METFYQLSLVVLSGLMIYMSPLLEDRVYLRLSAVIGGLGLMGLGICALLGVI